MSTTARALEVICHPMGWVGLVGQLLFTGRFLVQWIVSERQGASVMPIAFWFFSMAGGLMLLFYALWRKDPVIALGQIVGLFVYGRNLNLINRQSRSPSR